MNTPLATVEKVANCIKLPNSHSLSSVTVLGWKVVTGRDEHRDGDLAVYIRIDSIIPEELIEKLKLEFLKKNGRLKTIRLRGAISQGLVLPLKIIPEKYHKEGADVSSYLNITKWEPPAPSYQKGSKTRPKRFSHPGFDKYTKIQNIKNYNLVFKAEDEIHVSEKIHGTNVRYGNLKIAKARGLINFFKYYWKRLTGKKYEFVYGSHNVQLSNTSGKSYYEDNVYLQIAKRYNLMKLIPKDTIIYGEIFGPGIQKGYEYGLKEIDVRFFDAKVNEKYLPVHLFKKLIFELDLLTTPHLFIGPLKDIDLNDLKQGPSVLDPNQKVREGCVVKSIEEVSDFRLGRKILKCISEEYLLKKGNTDFH